MKLPTLNVDVTVNTKTMQKGIRDAQKQLQTVGRQGLALGGGGFGKLGAAAGMAGAMGFGAAGSAGIGIGGVVLSIMAPFKGAELIVNAFADATKKGQEAMQAFAEGKSLGGIDLGTASRLAAAAPTAEMAAASEKALSETFFGSMVDERGAVGGIAGLIKDWAELTVDGMKVVAASAGAALGGYGIAEQQRRADMATSRSAAGAQAYMTQAEINAIGAAREAEKTRKAQREQNT